jgi:hypothetical protein
MMTLPVDPGFFFDFMSIQEVKLDLNRTAQNATNWRVTHVAAVAQLGDDRVEEILNSDEYVALYAINREVFDAVDKAKTDAVTASQVDALNYRRYQVKQILQKRFFETEATEQKVGY